MIIWILLEEDNLFGLFVGMMTLLSLSLYLVVGVDEFFFFAFQDTFQSVRMVGVGSGPGVYFLFFSIEFKLSMQNLLLI